MTVFFEADSPDNMINRICNPPFQENKVGSLSIWNMDEKTNLKEFFEATNPDWTKKKELDK